MEDQIASVLRGSGLRAAIAHIEPLPASWRSKVWRVELADGRALLFRQRSEGRQEWTEKEKGVHDRLRGLLSGRCFAGYEMKIPRILAVAAGGECVQEFFAGAPLWELLGSAHIEQLLVAAGAAARALHELPVAKWGLVGWDGPDWAEWSSFLRWWFRLVTKGVPDAEGRIDAVTGQMEPTVAAPRMVHGDLGPHNILGDADAKTIAVIDWESAMGGDPMLDLGIFRADTAHHADLAEAFEKGYFGRHGPTIQQRDAISHYSALRRLQAESWISLTDRAERL